MAAGTSPNTTYEREYPGAFSIDKKGFFDAHQVVRGSDGSVQLAKGAGFFTNHIDEEGRTVSFYGDNHPRYAGQRGARDGVREGWLPEVARAFSIEIERALADTASQPLREARWKALATSLTSEVKAIVVAVNRLTPTILEVVVHAPAQARAFRPGQFYRLQNFETTAPRVEGTSLLMEGIALTGAWTDRRRACSR